VAVKRAPDDVLVIYSDPAMIGPVLDMIEERLRAGSGKPRPARRPRRPRGLGGLSEQ
jgi:hypothetical protein